MLSSSCHVLCSKIWERQIKNCAKLVVDVGPWAFLLRAYVVLKRKNVRCEHVLWICIAALIRIKYKVIPTEARNNRPSPSIPLDVNTVGPRTYIPRKKEHARVLFEVIQANSLLRYYWDWWTRVLLDIISVLLRLGLKVLKMQWHSLLEML